MRNRNLLILSLIVSAVALQVAATADSVQSDDLLMDKLVIADATCEEATPVYTANLLGELSFDAEEANECSTCIRHCIEDTGQTAEWCRVNVCTPPCTHNTDA